MAVRVTAAYLSENALPADRIPSVLSDVHRALSSLATAEQPSAEKWSRRPAVSVAKSVAPNYIVCLEDGRRMKMLKRHLKAAYGLTPEEYRQRWNLPSDYPLVAPRYAQQRSQFAKKMGLGKNRVGSGD
ncbi:MAG: MucR family transcriptional regulator [Rhodospirillaceae bacterium]